VLASGIGTFLPFSRCNHFVRNREVNRPASGEDPEREAAEGLAFAGKACAGVGRLSGYRAPALLTA
jgi:hypothetical protein